VNYNPLETKMLALRKNVSRSFDFERKAHD
jgi:hypothetical protein